MKAACRTARQPRQPRPRDARGRDADVLAHWLQVGGAFLLVWAAALAKEIGITTVRSAPGHHPSTRYQIKGMSSRMRGAAKCAAPCT